MEHWFASAAIIQNNSFDHLPCNIPQMPLLDLSPQSFLRAKDCDLSSKNTVVTFPVLCKNELSYAEVVDIMDSYEDHIVDIYRKANFNLDGVKVHIGGDQLTRERFSGAKRVRQQAATSSIEDEQLIIHSLLPMQPFSCVPGRQMSSSYMNSCCYMERLEAKMLAICSESSTFRPKSDTRELGCLNKWASFTIFSMT